MSEINIGKKISEFRKNKQITLSELAKLTNLTASMLSQIENNLANPSINTLESIAIALEVPMFSFFVDDQNINDLIVRSDERVRISSGGDQNSFYELLTRNLQGSIQFGLMTLYPDTCFFEKPIEHMGEEVALVIQGSVKLALDEDEKTFILNTGDSLRIPPYTKHRLFNDNPETAVIVFAITPPSF